MAARSAILAGDTTLGAGERVFKTAIERQWKDRRLIACRTAAPQAGASGADAKPPIVIPGAPEQASQIITAERASDLSKVQYTGDDIKFMQGMIGHHAQAIQIVQLVPSRTASEDLKKLALLKTRIEARYYEKALERLR